MEKGITQWGCREDAGRSEEEQLNVLRKAFELDFNAPFLTK